jgi:hypothetical protein
VNVDGGGRGASDDVHGGTEWALSSNAADANTNGGVFFVRCHNLTSTLTTRSAMSDAPSPVVVLYEKTADRPMTTPTPAAISVAHGTWAVIDHTDVARHDRNPVFPLPLSLVRPSNNLSAAAAVAHERELALGIAGNDARARSDDRRDPDAPFNPYDPANDLPRNVTAQTATVSRVRARQFKVCVYDFRHAATAARGQTASLSSTLLRESLIGSCVFTLPPLSSAAAAAAAPANLFTTYALLDSRGLPVADAAISLSLRPSAAHSLHHATVHSLFDAALRMGAPAQPSAAVDSRAASHAPNRDAARRGNDRQSSTGFEDTGFTNRRGSVTGVPRDGRDRHDEADGGFGFATSSSRNNNAAAAPNTFRDDADGNSALMLPPPPRMTFSGVPKFTPAYAQGHTFVGISVCLRGVAEAFLDCSVGRGGGARVAGTGVGTHAAGTEHRNGSGGGGVSDLKNLFCVLYDDGAGVVPLPSLLLQQQQQQQQQRSSVANGGNGGGDATSVDAAWQNDCLVSQNFHTDADVGGGRRNASALTRWLPVPYTIPADELTAAARALSHTEIVAYSHSQFHTGRDAFDGGAATVAVTHNNARGRRRRQRRHDAHAPVVAFRSQLLSSVGVESSEHAETVAMMRRSRHHSSAGIADTFNTDGRSNTGGTAGSQSRSSGGSGGGGSGGSNGNATEQWRPPRSTVRMRLTAAPRSARNAGSNGFSRDNEVGRDPRADNGCSVRGGTAKIVTILIYDAIVDDNGGENIDSRDSQYENEDGDGTNGRIAITDGSGGDERFAPMRTAPPPRGAHRGCLLGYVQFDLVKHLRCTHTLTTSEQRRHAHARAVHAARFSGSGGGGGGSDGGGGGGSGGGSGGKRDASPKRTNAINERDRGVNRRGGSPKRNDDAVDNGGKRGGDGGDDDDSVRVHGASRAYRVFDVFGTPLSYSCAGEAGDLDDDGCNDAKLHAKLRVRTEILADDRAAGRYTSNKGGIGGAIHGDERRDGGGRGNSPVRGSPSRGDRDRDRSGGGGGVRATDTAPTKAQVAPVNDGRRRDIAGVPTVLHVSDSDRRAVESRRIRSDDGHRRDAFGSLLDNGDNSDDDDDIFVEDGREGIGGGGDGYAIGGSGNGGSNSGYYAADDRGGGGGDGVVALGYGNVVNGDDDVNVVYGTTVPSGDNVVTIDDHDGWVCSDDSASGSDDDDDDEYDSRVASKDGVDNAPPRLICACTCVSHLALGAAVPYQLALRVHAHNLIRLPAIQYAFVVVCLFVRRVGSTKFRYVCQSDAVRVNGGDCAVDAAFDADNDGSYGAFDASAGVQSPIVVGDGGLDGVNGGVDAGRSSGEHNDDAFSHSARAAVVARAERDRRRSGEVTFRKLLLVDYRPLDAELATLGADGTPAATHSLSSSMALPSGVDKYASPYFAAVAALPPAPTTGAPPPSRSPWIDDTDGDAAFIANELRAGDELMLKAYSVPHGGGRGTRGADSDAFTGDEGGVRVNNGDCVGGARVYLRDVVRGSSRHRRHTAVYLHSPPPPTMSASSSPAALSTGALPLAPHAQLDTAPQLRLCVVAAEPVTAFASTNAATTAVAWSSPGAGGDTALRRVPGIGAVAAVVYGSERTMLVAAAGSGQRRVTLHVRIRRVVSSFNSAGAAAAAPGAAASSLPRSSLLAAPPSMHTFSRPLFVVAYMRAAVDGGGDGGGGGGRWRYACETEMRLGRAERVRAPLGIDDGDVGGDDEFVYNDVAFARELDVWVSGCAHDVRLCIYESTGEETNVDDAAMHRRHAQTRAPRSTRRRHDGGALADETAIAYLGNVVVNVAEITGSGGHDDSGSIGYAIESAIVRVLPTDDDTDWSGDAARAASQLRALSLPSARRGRPAASPLFARVGALVVRADASPFAAAMRARTRVPSATSPAAFPLFVAAACKHLPTVATGRRAGAELNATVECGAAVAVTAATAARHAIVGETECVYACAHPQFTTHFSLLVPPRTRLPRAVRQHLRLCRQQQSKRAGMNVFPQPNPSGRYPHGFAGAADDTAAAADEAQRGWRSADVVDLTDTGGDVAELLRRQFERRGQTYRRLRVNGDGSRAADAMFVADDDNDDDDGNVAPDSVFRFTVFHEPQSRGGAPGTRSRRVAIAHADVRLSALLGFQPKTAATTTMSAFMQPMHRLTVPLHVTHTGVVTAAPSLLTLSIVNSLCFLTPPHTARNASLTTPPLLAAHSLYAGLRSLPQLSRWTFNASALRPRVRVFANGVVDAYTSSYGAAATDCVDVYASAAANRGDVSVQLWRLLALAPTSTQSVTAAGAFTLAPLGLRIVVPLTLLFCNGAYVGRLYTDGVTGVVTTDDTRLSEHEQAEVVTAAQQQQHAAFEEHTTALRAASHADNYDTGGRDAVDNVVDDNSGDDDDSDLVEVEARGGGALPHSSPAAVATLAAWHRVDDRTCAAIRHSALTPTLRDVSSPAAASRWQALHAAVAATHGGRRFVVQCALSPLPPTVTPPLLAPLYSVVTTAAADARNRLLPGEAVSPAAAHVCNAAARAIVHFLTAARRVRLDRVTLVFVIDVTGAPVLQSFVDARLLSPTTPLMAAAQVNPLLALQAAMQPMTAASGAAFGTSGFIDQSASQARLQHAAEMDARHAAAAASAQPRRSRDARPVSIAQHVRQKHLARVSRRPVDAVYR